MVMLLNIGLAIIFVHFLTWWCSFSGKFHTNLPESHRVTLNFFIYFFIAIYYFWLVSVPMLCSWAATSSPLHTNQLLYVAVEPWQPLTVASLAWKMKMAPVRHGGGRRCFRNQRDTEKETRGRHHYYQAVVGLFRWGPALWNSSPLARLKKLRWNVVSSEIFSVGENDERLEKLKKKKKIWNKIK